VRARGPSLQCSVDVEPEASARAASDTPAAELVGVGIHGVAADTEHGRELLGIYEPWRPCAGNRLAQVLGNACSELVELRLGECDDHGDGSGGTSKPERGAGRFTVRLCGRSRYSARVR
jgi:hypothetical protein